MLASLGKKAAKDPEGRTAGRQKKQRRAGLVRSGFAWTLTLALVLSLAACSTPDSGPDASSAVKSDPAVSQPAGNEPVDSEPIDSESSVSITDENGLALGKALVAYFSRAGENYAVGVVSKGNTAIVAELIAELTGGDLFEIEPVTPYPSSYEETRVISTQEADENARPPIAGTVDNMEQYDTVFIGYPIWRVDLPMIVYNFLESYDFSGKTVIPFNTHGGSGQAGTQKAIESKLPDSAVLGGIAIPGTTAQESPDETRELVVEWLAGLGVPID